MYLGNSNQITTFENTWLIFFVAYGWVFWQWSHTHQSELLSEKAHLYNLKINLMMKPQVAAYDYDVVSMSTSIIGDINLV